jgi:hypothetical protein
LVALFLAFVCCSVTPRKWPTRVCAWQRVRGGRAELHWIRHDFQISCAGRRIYGAEPSVKVAATIPSTKRGTAMRHLKTAFASTLLVLGCTFASAQTSTNQVSTNETDSSGLTYEFKTVDFPNDPFTQLLGINDEGVIAGYHGSGATGSPNKGFTLTLPKTFTPENFPGSVQTQVIGINNDNDTVGFYVDAQGNTHAFIKDDGQFYTKHFPGTAFNQFLGINNLEQAAGYWQDVQGNFHPYVWGDRGGVFLSILIPGATSAQATGVNDRQSFTGFFIDKNGVNHGFLLARGSLTTLDFPGSTLTQALGLNNRNDVVGFYTDAAGLTHGFLWRHGKFHAIDDPAGVGTTIVNGINDRRHIVGFYGNTAGGISHGFVAEPEDE